MLKYFLLVPTLSLVLFGCGMRGLLTADADLQLGDGGLGDGLGPACGYGPPCDPANLGGETCESLGHPAGRLTCVPDTCVIDISGCGASDDAGVGSTPTGQPSAGSPSTGGTPAPPPPPALPPLFGGAATDAAVPPLFGGAATDAAAPLFGGGFFGTTPDAGPGADDDAG